MWNKYVMRTIINIIIITIIIISFIISFVVLIVKILCISIDDDGQWAFFNENSDWKNRKKGDSSQCPGIGAVSFFNDDKINPTNSFDIKLLHTGFVYVFKTLPVIMSVVPEREIIFVKRKLLLKNTRIGGTCSYLIRVLDHKKKTA